ncbi:hypothetical protein FRB99_002147 [Tulasnella sp. 403]|nr:hypothetical protein FRB99_002147 [Tulasnella sp. 403]
MPSRMLLLWLPALSPEGKSDISAIKFTAPVCIDFLRIIPNGVSPFLKDPNCVGETTPGAFSLDVYMHLLVSGEGQPRSMSNSLMTTKLEYAGEMLDHVVQMKPPYTTRLLLLKGKFKTISLAVYGELAAKATSERPTATIPVPDRSNNALPAPGLPNSLNPTELENPLLISQQLLASATSEISVESIFQHFYEYMVPPKDDYMHTDQSSSSERQSPVLDLSEVKGSRIVGIALRLRDAVTLTGYEVPEMSADDAKLYLAVVGVLAGISWAIQQEELSIITRGLSILRLWQADSKTQMALDELSLLIHWAIPTLMHCCRLPQTKVVSLARRIMQQAISRPVDVLSYAPVLEDQLEHVLPVVTEKVLNVVRESGWELALKQLGQLGHCDSLNFAQTYAFRIAVAKVSLFTRAGSEERGRVIAAAREILGQPLLYALLDALPTILGRLRLSPAVTGGEIITPQLQAQLLHLSAECLRVTNDLLPTQCITSRMGKVIAFLVLEASCAAVVSSQARPGESPITRAAGSVRSEAFAVLKSTRELLAQDSHGHAEILRILFTSVTARPHDARYITVLPGQVYDLVSGILYQGDDALQQKTTADIVGLLPELARFLPTLDAPERAALVSQLMNIDEGRAGVGEWVLQNDVSQLREAIDTLVVQSLPNAHSDATLAHLLRHTVDKTFTFLSHLLTSGASADAIVYLSSDGEASHNIEQCFRTMLDQDISSFSAFDVAQIMASADVQMDRALMLTLVLTLLRSTRFYPPPFHASSIFNLGLEVADIIAGEAHFTDVEFGRLASELGCALNALVGDKMMDHWGDPSIMASSIVGFFDLMKRGHAILIEGADERMIISDDSTPFSFDGVSEAVFDELMNHVDQYATPDSPLLSSFKPLMQWSDYQPEELNPLLNPQEPLTTTIDALSAALEGEQSSRPMTPPPSTPPTILGMAALSPFTVLRSPTARVASLTKTYLNNDFRQQRTSPNMNTSRPPSMHVDEFQGSPPPPAQGSSLLQQSPLAPWQF